jgi:hypothetical protein
LPSSFNGTGAKRTLAVAISPADYSGAIDLPDEMHYESGCSAAD